MDPALSAPADSAPALATLHEVPWLKDLGPEALHHVSERATPVRFAPGQTLLAELEAGDDLYVLLEGKARVHVAAAGGRIKEIGVLGPGDACGEISVLTRELRSATVTAVEPVRALRLERADFESLLARHPTIAVHFARLLSARLEEADARLDAIVSAASWSEDPSASRAGIEPLPSLAAPAAPAQATIRRAWRELVSSRHRELPFFALVAFLVASLVVRLVIALASHLGLELFGLLRTAYTSGIALVFLSTAAALLRFRARWQRSIALVLGAGFALILNQLSVFLAFDVFYLDMTTLDPNMVFSVEALYRRSESEWAVSLMFGFLVLLTYVRHFLRRALFVAVSALRRRPRAPG